MLTFADVLDRACAALEKVRQLADAEIEAAEDAKQDMRRVVTRRRALSKHHPDDIELRIAVEDAEILAARTGRRLDRVLKMTAERITGAEDQLELVRFEAAVEDHVSAIAAVPVDQLPAGVLDQRLLALSDGDAYLCGALHLARDGHSVPSGWRSPSGARYAQHRRRSPGPDQS